MGLPVDFHKMHVRLCETCHLCGVALAVPAEADVGMNRRLKWLAKRGPYLSLRKMENEVIRLLLDSRTANTKTEQAKISAGQIVMGIGIANPIRVSIRQFYGIEINDFAATVAKTALWIAESQMMKQTEDIVHTNLDFLPLKSYVNIIEGNALRIDWETVVPKRELNYIMGTPPFVGARLTSEAQKSDLNNVFPD